MTEDGSKMPSLSGGGGGAKTPGEQPEAAIVTETLGPPPAWCQACPLVPGSLRPGRDGFLDTIYGVLFDPANTFRGLAPRPPVFLTVIIFFLVKLTLSLMGYIVIARLLLVGRPTPLAEWFLHGAGPLLVLGALVFCFGKWFLYSGVLNLLADLLGGRGRARGVLVVYGLAAIPMALLVPAVILFLLILPPEFPGLFFSIFVALGLASWSVSLLVVGIREVHGLTTNRAVLVVGIPVAVMAAVAVICLVMLVSLSVSVSRLLELF